MTKYIVFRAWPDAPPGWMPDDLEGKWIERPDLVPAPPWMKRLTTTAEAAPTGRFERREDGEWAEVFEVRPPAATM